MRSAKYAHDAIHDRLKLYSVTSNISTTAISSLKSLKRRYPASHPIPVAGNSDDCILDCVPLTTDGQGEFFDEIAGRRVTLKGINVDSQTKLPASPYMPSYGGDSTDPNNVFFDGDNVSFVGRPFPLEDAAVHLQRIKNWGYNTIRYLLTWEAIEHKGPGIYDLQFAEYTVEILKIIAEVKGLYVFLEFHQDVWSRYSGGSGAPMWTFYAAGLDPRNFAANEAAILHNDPRFHESSEIYHKMLWTSNYKRLAPLVMFTMFFAGKNYFPSLEMNGENIQDYLQNKYLGAVEFIWSYVVKHVPELIDNGTILGFESMNEPNSGLVGHPKLDQLPANQQLRVGTTPTVFQAIKLGSGITCEVDEYQITITGPRKCGTRIVDPKGVSAWMTPEVGKEVDARYGFKRSDNWKLGTCLFAQAGIWEPSPSALATASSSSSKNMDEITQSQRLEIGNNCKMLEPEFFSKIYPQHNYEEHLSKRFPKVDTALFINYHFVNHIIKFKQVIRKYRPDVFVLFSTPVLEEPPDLINDSRKVIDAKTVYCPHYYDGLSLMFKSWNSRYNVDTLGIMRGCYLNPVLGIVFGERAIRNCIKKQFIEMRNECNKYLGPIPILMSETGMPFDMDEKRSYRNGKYISQTAALDAICNALEGAHNMSHTFWCYNSQNNHKWGDNWNNEDFSFWSPEDRDLTFEDSYTSIDNVTMHKLNSDSTASVIPSFPAGKKKTDRKLRKAKRKLGKISTSNSSSSLSTKMGFSSSKNSTMSTNSESSYERTFLKSPTPEGNNGYNNNDENPAYVEEALKLTGSAPAATSMSRSSSVSSSQSVISSTSSNVHHHQIKKCFASPDGVRAVSAVIRPYCIATRGRIVASEFDLKSRKFSLQISIDTFDRSNNKYIPTVVFVPKWHFPYLDYGDVYLTSGYIKYNEQLEYIEWYHAPDPSIVEEEEGEDGKEDDDDDNDDEKKTAMKKKKNNATLMRTETIVIKNNSGSLEEMKSIEKGGSDSSCPIT
ncbi:uncharacterized protein LODBEIA_P53650 [Lodderomyces beijingensis]|uniref:Uncharacterized protein n=1 Tax=Lodderomyces beijingensis TaxID=1775926 RepID=A0ABP0ZSM9_9ASCO